MKNEGIQQFVKDATKRLNRGLALTIAGWAVIVTGAILLIHAAVYRVQGEEVPWGGALVIAFYALAIGGAVWFMRLRSSRESALIADKELGLKDSLTSAMEFEDQDSEVYGLQLKQTEKLLSERKTKDIPITLPKRSLFVGGGLAALAIGLGFLPASEAVQKRIAQETLTEERSDQIKTELEDYVEEFIAAMDEEEKEVLSPEELKKWVKELKSTKDQKEAMRQLARFEEKITKAMSKMESRKDEEAMKAAAAELAKSDQAAARQLGKKLEKKDFKLAAEDLKKLAEAAKLKDPKDLKNLKKLTPKELAKKKGELKKLREMTKRMANAAKKRGGQKKKLGKAGGAMGKGGGKNMGDLLGEMDGDAKALQGEIAKGKFAKGDWDKGARFQKRFGKNLKRFRGKLRKMHGKNRARRRLADMRMKLGKAQRFANGQTQALGLARIKGAGGLQPGVGTDSSRRKQRDESQDNGNVASLEGQKGTGPSITAVEDADSGTGISSKTGETRTREFRRQMESFVRRDDVPEDVKMGVKEYFERVHEVAPE